MNNTVFQYLQNQVVGWIWTKRSSLPTPGTCFYKIILYVNTHNVQTPTYPHVYVDMYMFKYIFDSHMYACVFIYVSVCVCTYVFTDHLEKSIFHRVF